MHAPKSQFLIEVSPKHSFSATPGVPKYSTAVRRKRIPLLSVKGSSFSTKGVFVLEPPLKRRNDLNPSLAAQSVLVYGVPKCPQRVRASTDDKGVGVTIMSANLDQFVFTTWTKNIHNFLKLLRHREGKGGCCALFGRRVHILRYL